MNIDKLSIKYDKALELKKGEKYADVLKLELSKPEWKDALSSISDRMGAIGSKSDFGKCLKQLEDLFDNIYEKITAPGLDAFIEWINAHTKNQDNVKRLRQFLKSNYEAYSSSINSLFSVMEGLPMEDEKHLFDSMIVFFNRALKSDVTAFINAPDKFENNIDGFLSSLIKEYEGMSGIVELPYTSIDQLYTEQQRAKTNISFYEDLIKHAIKEGQSLKELDESEKDLALYIRANNRIRSVKSCISTLLKTGIADSNDEDLKELFLRFEKDMFSSKGDVSKILTNYLDKVWEPLVEKYTTIKQFYEQEDLEFEESDWSDFEKSADITALYTDYLDVRQGNVLPQLSSTSTEDVTNKITKCSKKISDLIDKENNTGATVRQYFEDFLDTYNNKRPMLEKLLEKHPEIQSQYNKIYTDPSNYLTTITNGVNGLKKDRSFLSLLSEGDIHDMIEDMKKTKESFIEILKLSQMEEQLDWLNGLSSTTISEADFNSDYLLKLIKDGLITLSFKKEF